MPGLLFDTIFKTSSYRMLSTYGVSKWIDGNPYLVLFNLYILSFLSSASSNDDLDFINVQHGPLLIQLVAEYMIDVALIVRQNSAEAARLRARESELKAPKKLYLLPTEAFNLETPHQDKSSSIESLERCWSTSSMQVRVAIRRLMCPIFPLNLCRIF